MNKFLNNVKELSPEAAKLMFFGTKLAFGVLLIGFLAYKYNQRFVGDYVTRMNCLELVRAGVSLLVQFITGGLILDCVVRKSK